MSDATQCSGAKDPPQKAVEGNGVSWQMVCNLTKSRPGGVGVGGILEGKPRARLKAWKTYQKIQDGAGNRFNFHHEQWYAPGGDSSERRGWGNLYLMGLEKKPAGSQ